MIKTNIFLDYFYPSPIYYHQDLSETSAIYTVMQMNYRFKNTKKLRNIILLNLHSYENQAFLRKFSELSPIQAVLSVREFEKSSSH